MKVRRISIENFKRFGRPGDGVELKIENRALDEVADRFLLLGDNGSGKTTVLQAAALVLSLASGRTKTVADFRWSGWVPERYAQHGPPVIEVDVSFTDDEITATQEAARRWYDRFHPTSAAGFVGPGDDHTVTLRLEGDRVRAAPRTLYQFRGRSYAAQLARTDQAARALFSRLPGIFWFDQFRNVAEAGGLHDDDRGGLEQMGVLRLREMLQTWSRKRERLGPHPDRDFLGELERLFGAIFPGRGFAPLEDVYEDGPAPVGERFVLTDGRRTYALEEMSAGEQSVFPILFEFVRLQVHHSVVLVDEIDLNLHPPLSQRVLGVLPQLGLDNQFIFTSHSQSIVDVVSPHTIYRLPGDALCL